MRISRGDPADVLARAELFAAETGVDDRLSVSLDADARTVTIIGPGAALREFERMLTTAESTITIDLETRTYEILNASATTIAGQLDRLAKRMLDPGDGSTFTQPRFESLEELDQLIVRAEPAQFGVIQQLVSMLDVAQPGSMQFRVVNVTGDPDALLGRARELYDIQTAGLDDDQAGPVEASIDMASGSIILSGSAGGHPRDVGTCSRRCSGSRRRRAPRR